MENDISATIGSRIQAMRKAHGMKQATLANLLGVSEKHISHVERGKSSLSLENLIDFCGIFNCSLDYIILGITEQNVVSKLPKQIANILYTGNDKEIDLLNRYLQIYVELLQKQD